MFPGGLYSDFLVSEAGFGVVKALCAALVAASKAHCAAIASVVEWQLAGQQATLLDGEWPSGAVASFLFGVQVAGVVLSEVNGALTGATEAMCRPSLRNVAAARALLAEPCSVTARRAVASLALVPIWRLYCVHKYPQRMGASSRRVDVTDFAEATVLKKLENS